MCRETIKEKIQEIIHLQPIKMVISKPKGSATYRKVTIERKKNVYHITKYTETQVFHDNLSHSEITSYCLSMMEDMFRQFNAWDEKNEYIIMLSKKGDLTYRSIQVEDKNKPKVTEEHDNRKTYLLKEGIKVAPLIDMGILSPDGKVIHAMYDKYRQVNRFIEQIDDVIRKIPNLDHINIVDFGCGKSYLTFVLYYYFAEIKKIEANILGLDLKADVIHKCNKAAKKYGYDGLKFELGDIKGFHVPFDVDMVITLHACDTATDYALYNAVKWNSKMIFSVPCCQHELNSQIEARKLPILANYGIIKERFSALSTDAIRGNILEYYGYKTQLLEFVDFTHTTKNILIRAVKKTHVTKSFREKKLLEVKQLMEAFGFRPTLYQLLMKGNEW